MYKEENIHNRMWTGCEPNVNRMADSYFGTQKKNDSAGMLQGKKINK